MRLNFTSFTDLDTALYLDKWTYETIITYTALIQVSRIHNCNIFPELHLSDLNVFYCGDVHTDKISTTFLACLVPVKHSTPFWIQSK